MTEFIKMDDCIKDAMLTILKYLKAATGVEPTQDEVATLLKSYFILNEVGNQIKYQLKKEVTKTGNHIINAKGPAWKLNLKEGPTPNMLARAGVFHISIKEALDETRRYIKKTMGTDPGYEIVAKSLKSSFILSEIKNQFVYHRKQK